MYFSAYSVLSMTLLLRHCTSQVSEEHEVEILTAVRKCLHDPGIFLLYSSRQMCPYTNNAYMRRQISLFRNQIQTAVVNISSIAAPEEWFRYRQKRPLFVLPTESEALRLDLEQLPSRFPLAGSRWLLFLDDKTTAEDFLRDVDIPFDCEFLVVQRSSETFMVITELYNLEGHLQTNHWGNWSHRNGLLGPTNSMYNRRSDLQGVILKAAAAHDHPFDLLIETGDKLEIRGYSADLWNYLEGELNFTTQFVKARDNAWGSVKADGSWSGMIGMIVDGEVDAATNIFMMTPSRVGAVDYLMPTATSRTCVFIRTPDTSTSWHTFLAPLSTSLWLVFLVTILCTACVLTAVRRLGGHEGGLVDSLFRTWGTFCIQGQSDIPHVSSCRLLFWVTNISAIIMMGAYSANFVANSTVRQIHLPFTDLKGLLKDKSYEFQILADSGLLTIFHDATDEVMQDLYVQRLKPNLARLPGEHLLAFQRLCKRRRYAFMEAYDAYLSVSENVTCAVSVLPDTFFLQNFGLIFSKTLPYRGLIKHTLASMRRTGILNRVYLTKWVFSLSVKDDGSSAKSIPLKDVTAPFAILAVGVSVSGVALLAEMLRRRLTRPRGLVSH